MAMAGFEAFCRAEFPGLGTVTRASAEAWIAMPAGGGQTAAGPPALEPEQNPGQAAET